MFADDAEQKGSKVDLKSGTLEMVLDGGVNQFVGYRFANLAIPAVAVIMSANIQFTADRPGWVSGNAMAFVDSGRGLRVASSCNNNRNRAAKLVVTYFAP